MKMSANIYIAIEPEKQKYTEGLAEDVEYDESQTPRCPKCHAPIAGMKWVGDKKVSITKKPLPDFLYIYGGAALPFLVSEKAMNCLLENGITGIEKYEPINSFFIKKAEKTLNYYDLSITRLDLPIDHEKSQINYGTVHPEQICELCNPKGCTKDFIFSLHLKNESAPECDIFHIYEMGSTAFLSERFIKVVEDNKLTGLSYVDIHDFDPVARELFQ